MYLNHIKTMVRERKLKRGLKPVPQIPYNKRYKCSTNVGLLLSMGGSQLNKRLKIGGIIIQ